LALMNVKAHHGMEMISHDLERIASGALGIAVDRELQT
jgi:hypothetical protein